MKADFFSLSHNCRELFTVIDMTKSLGKSVAIPIGETTINVSIHEINIGALILENTVHTLKQVL